jgi:hypothetical protein
VPVKKRFMSNLLQNRPPMVAVIMVSALESHGTKAETFLRKKLAEKARFCGFAVQMEEK